MSTDDFVAYPAVYRDVEAEEHVTLLSNGRSLKLTVGGTLYAGNTFDLLAQQPVVDEEYFFLAWYTLDYAMPLTVIVDGQPQRRSLKVHVAIEWDTEPPPGWDEGEGVRLELDLEGATLIGEGEWFEDAMERLQKQMPEGSYLRCCFTCMFSDYSPYGHNFFGDLACFRDNKAGYLAAEHSKFSLMAIWHTNTEFVQETYLCPEFERRRPGTGYRG